MSVFGAPNNSTSLPPANPTFPIAPSSDWLLGTFTLSIPHLVDPRLVNDLHTVRARPLRGAQHVVVTFDHIGYSTGSTYNTLVARGARKSISWYSQSIGAWRILGRGEEISNKL